MWILGDYYSESRIFTWVLNSPSTLDDINSHRYHFASNDVFFPLHIKALFWTYVTNDNILHGRHSLTLSRTETRQKFKVILRVTSLITKKKSWYGKQRYLGTLQIQVKEIRTRHSITNTPTHLQVSSDTTSFHDSPVVCNGHTRPSFFENGIGLHYFVAYS